MQEQQEDKKGPEFYFADSQATPKGEPKIQSSSTLINHARALILTSDNTIILLLMGASIMSLITAFTLPPEESWTLAVQENNILTYISARIALKIPTGVLVDICNQLKVECTKIMDAVVHTDFPKSKQVFILIKSEAVDSCPTCHLADDWW